jgi:hypothetical protein
MGDQDAMKNVFAAVWLLHVFISMPWIWISHGFAKALIPFMLSPFGVEAILLIGSTLTTVFCLVFGLVKTRKPIGDEQESPLLHLPKIFFIFDNEEDGVGGPVIASNHTEEEWLEQSKNWPVWFRVIMWNVVRNHAHNSKFTWWGTDNIEDIDIRWCNDVWPGYARKDYNYSVMIRGWKMGIWIVRRVVHKGVSYKLTHRMGWGIGYPYNDLSGMQRFQGFKLQPYRYDRI